MGAAAVPALVAASAFQMYQGYQNQQDQKKQLNQMKNQTPPVGTPPPTASNSLTPDTGSQLRRKLQGMRYGIASTLQSNPLLSQSGGMMGGGLKTKVGQ